MYRTILTVSAACMLVASGAVHGLWTDRWTADPQELRDAAERLAQLPMTLGKWDGSEIDMKGDTQAGLSGVVARRFVHRETGKVISIYLACGRPGPVCIHTPDACYPSDGFTEAEPMRRISLGSAGATPAEFWTARYMRQRADAQTNTRVFWTWHTRDGWKVADNPREAFAGESVMHKLYVIRDLAGPNELAAQDVCAEFVQELLPLLEQRLFDR